MGMINVQLKGSFPHRSVNFSALKHGHARAIADAIAWLSNEALPAAIRQDHDLHAEGAKPSGPFGAAKASDE